MADEDEEDEFIYNPLKLPLGWDGKPIPYWLYKLHGLNQEFKCEICGNYSYWGRWVARVMAASGAVRLVVVHWWMLAWSDLQAPGRALML